MLAEADHHYISSLSTIVLQIPRWSFLMDDAQSSSGVHDDSMGSDITTNRISPPIRRPMDYSLRLEPRCGFPFHALHLTSTMIRSSRHSTRKCACVNLLHRGPERDITPLSKDMHVAPSQASYVSYSRRTFLTSYTLKD